MRTAERRALVAEYYAIAPALVAAIPSDHAEWERIAGAVDTAADAIRAGDEDRAFEIYVELVGRLRADWGATAGLGHECLRHECLRRERPAGDTRAADAGGRL